MTFFIIFITAFYEVNIVFGSFQRDDLFNYYC
jgi:hypothetical protein